MVLAIRCCARFTSSGPQPLHKYLRDDANFALANGTSVLLDPRPTTASGCPVPMQHGPIVKQMAAKVLLAWA